jgi:hypothetical protein
VFRQGRHATAASLAALSLPGSLITACLAVLLTGCGNTPPISQECSHSPLSSPAVPSGLRAAPDFGMLVGVGGGTVTACTQGDYIVALRTTCPGNRTAFLDPSDRQVAVAGKAYPGANSVAGHDSTGPVVLAHVTLSPGEWTLGCADKQIGEIENTILGPHKAAATSSVAAQELIALEARTGCPTRFPCDAKRFSEGLSHVTVPPQSDFAVANLRGAIAGITCPETCYELTEVVALDSVIREDLGLTTDP